MPVTPMTPANRKRLAELNAVCAKLEMQADARDGILTPQERIDHGAAMAEIRLLHAGATAIPRRTPDNAAAPLGEGMFDGGASHHYGRARNFHGVRNGRRPEERAHALGQWCLAAIGRSMPGRFQFPDAERFCEDRWGPQALMTETDATTGGHFTVPEEFGDDMLSLMEKYGVARRLFRRRPMTSDTRVDPIRASGLTAYFVDGETTAGTESNKTWGATQLTAKTLMVLSRFSAQLSADSVISLADDLSGEIAQAFAEKEDQCAFNGDGTSTYAGIHGVRAKLQTSAGSPTTTSAGGIIVGAGNAYSELLLTDFEAVAGLLPLYADADATWVVSKLFYHTVMQRLELAAGGVTAREIRDGERGRPTFLGYPVEFSQVMPSTAANSQVCALLGDFRLGASFGDRQQMGVLFSEHATVGGQSVFERNQIAIRGIERFDIVVHGTGDTTTAGPIVGLQTLNS